jgi:hypothetical protein
MDRPRTLAILGLALLLAFNQLSTFGGTTAPSGSFVENKIAVVNTALMKNVSKRSANMLEREPILDGMTAQSPSDGSPVEEDLAPVKASLAQNTSNVTLTTIEKKKELVLQ